MQDNKPSAAESDFQNHRLERYFRADHLPEPLKTCSLKFRTLAIAIRKNCNEDPAEQTTALRKLLEAKDAAVRALIPRISSQDSKEII